jgi:hypothetical protein
LGEANENGWEIDRVCEGNGFRCVDGSEFGLEAFVYGLPLRDPNRLAFGGAVGNGLDAGPVTGNGLFEYAFVPRKPFCAENGLTPVGAGCKGPV